ncbi:MAG: T9SS type A sorting domain-containing protein [Chitinophagales bacterium]|nr:T9SS type A sorting domain-containing protein [Chitinophagales bacterium]
MLNNNLEESKDSSLIDQLNDLNFQRTILIYKIIGEYSNADEVDSIADFLLSENENRMAVPYLLNQNRFDEVSKIISEIKQEEQEDIDYVSLVNLEISLKEKGKTWFDISDDDEKLIRQIANDSTLLSRQAQNILELVFGEDYPVVNPELPQEINKDERQFSYEGTKPLLRLYPNPASAFLTLVINGITSLKYDVAMQDIFGRSILQKQFFENGKYDIPVQGILAGMYLITISADDNQILTYKLIISK